MIMTVLQNCTYFFTVGFCIQTIKSSLKKFGKNLAFLPYTRFYTVSAGLRFRNSN
jgi:hypothetical protein